MRCVLRAIGVRVADSTLTQVTTRVLTPARRDTVKAEQDGVIASVSATSGTAVTKDTVLAEYYPLSSMRVEATVPADNRNDIRAGDKVMVELESDEDKIYEGTVTFISALPEENSDEDGDTCYRVLIDFTPDESVTFGMSVIVTNDMEETAEQTETEVKDSTAGT